MSGHDGSECIKADDLENWGDLDGWKKTDVILKIDECTNCKRIWQKYWATSQKGVKHSFKYY